MPQEGRNNRLIILGPRDLQFKTWYLNNGRLRTWPCVLWVKIDGTELNVMRGGKSWAGFRSLKKRDGGSRNLFLCPQGSPALVDD